MRMAPSPLLVSFLLLFLMAGCKTPQSTPSSNAKQAVETTDTATTPMVITFDVTGQDGALTLYLHGGEMDVDWNNDGTWDVQNQTDVLTHRYGAPGTYTIRIQGRRLHVGLCRPAPEFAFSTDLTDKEEVTQQVQDISRWGSTTWSSMHAMFRRCTTMRRWSATDRPDLSNVRDLSYMFLDAESFVHPIGDWDVSQATNMSGMFKRASTFDQPLNTWNTSNVTNMKSMFAAAKMFNQPLSAWDTSQVTTMENMFFNATSFNQPLHAWNTARVTTMKEMFWAAKNFNGAVGAWDTSQVTNMALMFRAAQAFDQPVEDWNTSQVTNMENMFYDATSFNESLDRWDVSHVEDMRAMFYKAKAFNRPLASWQVSNVHTMSNMFFKATAFSFGLGTWDVSNVKHMDKMLHRNAMGTDTYDTTLEGWARQQLQPKVKLGATGRTYCKAESAREKLVKTHHWIIEGDAKKCP